MSAYRWLVLAMLVCLSSLGAWVAFGPGDKADAAVAKVHQPVDQHALAAKMRALLNIAALQEAAVA